MNLYQAAALIGARVWPPDAPDVPIERLSCHPDRVTSEDCFGIFPEYFEYNQWSEASVGEAAARRCQPRVVVARAPLEGYGGIVLEVANPRQAFGRLARVFHGEPDRKMPVIGVTGTNGKTTTTHLIAHLVQRLAGSAGGMGTLGTFRNAESWRPGEFTTDLALPTMATLARFAERGTAAVAMEVSSHALALDRVSDLGFRVAVLTNIARDHLDFHGSQEAYVSAKERLFRELETTSTAVLNADDGLVTRIRGSTRAAVVTYGWHRGADWRVDDLELRRDGATIRVKTGGESFRFGTRLVGRFQVANVLAAAAAVAALGFAPSEILAAVEDFSSVKGRMEALGLKSGATAIIDYAHNPDGLDNLLSNCRAMRPRRLLLVFGCGGDRDRGKRPLMGAIAAAGADRIWVTSDNPRTEEPGRIVADILEGMTSGTAAEVEVDRAAAIRLAWAAAGPGDLLVIAGKGHEDYQIVGTSRTPFSDRGALLTLESSVA